MSVFNVNSLTFNPILSYGGQYLYENGDFEVSYLKYDYGVMTDDTEISYWGYTSRDEYSMGHYNELTGYYIDIMVYHDIASTPIYLRKIEDKKNKSITEFTNCDFLCDTCINYNNYLIL